MVIHRKKIVIEANNPSQVNTKIVIDTYCYVIRIVIKTIVKFKVMLLKILCHVHFMPKIIFPSIKMPKKD